MTDHLPECPRSSISDKYADAAAKIGIHAGDCICEPLRACEQRVRVNERDWRDQAYGIGYAAALDAAREAVEAVDPPSEAYDDWHPKGKRLALSAIDALREEQK